MVIRIRYSCDYPDCGKTVKTQKCEDLDKVPDGWQLYDNKFAVKSAHFIACSADHTEGMRVLNYQRLLNIGDFGVGKTIEQNGLYVGDGRLVGLGSSNMIGNKGDIAPAWAPMSDEGQRRLDPAVIRRSRETLDIIIKELDKKYVPGSPEQIAIEQLRQVDPKTLPLIAAKDIITSLDSLDYTAILYSDFRLIEDTLSTLLHKYMSNRDLVDGIYFVAENISRLNFGENVLMTDAVCYARHIKHEVIGRRGGGTQNIPTRKIGGNKKGRKMIYFAQSIFKNLFFCLRPEA